MEVTLSDVDDRVSVMLEPGQQYAFHEHETIFDTADGPPGSYADVTVAVADESETVGVTVRDGSLAWLAPYVPGSSG